MAMAVGDRDDNEPMMEMNTTPLIDVMLVMLVMFVITIPPPTHKVDVTLPAGPAPFEVRDENRVSIDTSDIIRWNGNAVDLAELGQLVKAASERAVPATLLFEPDAQAAWSDRRLRTDAPSRKRRSGGWRRPGAQMLHHIAGVVGLAERHPKMTHDGIGRDDVEVELRQRPVANIGRGGQVENHAVG